MLNGGVQLDDDGWYVYKDPDAEKPYTHDFAAAGDSYLEAGDTLLSADFTVLPLGLTVDTKTLGATSVTFWLRGGAAGATYQVQCRYQTNSGIKDDFTFRAIMRDQ